MGVTVNMKRSAEWIAKPQHVIGVLAIAICVVSLGMSESAFAQKGFAGCVPVSERTSEIGCWILASEFLGQPLPHPVFWHLDKFSTPALAEKVKEPGGTVVQALGKVWLLTIAEARWRPKGGEHITEIGPLPVNTNTKYVAKYMEAIMNPGMETRLHRHPGPEAWYTEGGETCLETPEGKQVGKKGVSVIVPGGQPMKLSVTGTEQRRSLVLVLHDASQPWMMVASDWTAKGLCGR
jgi:quercetin dioxygenase-like cupin family protein